MLRKEKIMDMEMEEIMVTETKVNQVEVMEATIMEEEIAVDHTCQLQITLQTPTVPTLMKAATTQTASITKFKKMNRRQDSIQLRIKQVEKKSKATTSLSREVLLEETLEVRRSSSSWRMMLLLWLILLEVLLHLWLAWWQQLWDLHWILYQVCQVWEHQWLLLSLTLASSQSMCVTVTTWWVVMVILPCMDWEILWRLLLQDKGSLPWMFWERLDTQAWYMASDLFVLSNNLYILRFW